MPDRMASREEMTPLLQIRTYPDKILQQPARPVEDIDGRLQELIEGMAQTMYAAPGVGLAAVQVGSTKRVLVYDIEPRDEKRDLHVLINPRIVTREGEILSENEGCLSIPDYRADVKRARSILVEGVDREGNPLRMEAEGFLAIVLQHEVDHLDGILIIDRISKLKRELFKKRVQKQLKRNA